MSFWDHVLGLSSQIDVQTLTAELQGVLIGDERILAGYKDIRDLTVFTSLRLLLIDKQGLTGSKKQYMTIPYRNISHFSVETAGSFLDADCELEIHMRGGQMPIVRLFKKGTDVVSIQRMLAAAILQSGK